MAASSASLSVKAIQRLDDTAIHTVGFPRLLLMEQAGRALADAVNSLQSTPGSCVICCGMGYNGGDGLCGAWHLVRRGWTPQVILLGSRRELKEEPAVFARIVESFHLPWVEAASIEEVDAVEERLRSCAVVVDALLGIGISGAVRPIPARLIALMNGCGRPIVSADVPSGLDADRGEPLGIAVRATTTVTFGCPKRGFFTSQGSSYVGRLLIDDLGLPEWLIREVS